MRQQIQSDGERIGSVGSGRIGDRLPRQVSGMPLPPLAALARWPPLPLLLRGAGCCAAGWDLGLSWGWGWVERGSASSAGALAGSVVRRRLAQEKTSQHQFKCVRT